MHKRQTMEPENVTRRSTHGISRNSNYCQYVETSEPFVNPETLFANYGLRGVFVWKSLCEFKIKLPSSKSELVETFSTTTPDTANSLRKYLVCNVVPSCEKRGDVNFLFDLLTCDDEQVQSQITAAIFSIQMSTDVRTQNIPNIVKNFLSLIETLPQYSSDVKYVTQILPIALNSLATLPLVVGTRIGKGKLMTDLEAACGTLRETLSTISQTVELVTLDTTIPLKQMLSCFSEGANKVVKMKISRLDDFVKSSNAKKKIHKHIATLSYLEQYTTVFSILQQISQRISNDKVDLLREVVSALLDRFGRKEKTEKLLFPILLVVTKVIVKLLNSTNQSQSVNIDIQLQYAYLQGILNIFLDSKKIAPARRVRLLEEVEVLLFHRSRSIVHTTLYWFDKNDVDPKSMVNKTLTYIERLLLKVNFRTIPAQPTPSLFPSPTWGSVQGVIGNSVTVDLHCLFPTLDCIKEGIMTDYKNKSNQEETEKRINSLEIMKILQEDKMHKNILSLYAFQCRPMPLFFIVESLNGCNLLTFLLQARIERNWRSPVFLANLVHDAIKALMHLQSKNIVHRNLIAKSFFIDAQYRLILTDFSIARCVDSEVVSVSELESKDVATRWCSPETLLEGKFDFKTDVWTLGQLIYEIYTHGCQPFTELYDTPTSKVMELVVFQSLKPKQWPCIPKEVHDIILACVQADPDDRSVVENIQSDLKQCMGSGKFTNTRFSVSRMCHVDKMFPDLQTKSKLNDQFIEKGIPKLFLDLKTMPADPRRSYAMRDNRVVSDHLEVVESELKSQDRPVYTEQTSIMEVCEPVTQAFVETVLPLLTGSIMNWLHIRQWPIVVHKRITDELQEYNCTLMYGCDEGESLLDIALSHRMGDFRRTSAAKADYYNILCQAAQLVENMHKKHFLLMDICCTNLHYCFKSGKVFMPRLGRICYLNPSCTLGDSVIGKEFKDRKHWVPLEVLQSKQYSTGSDVFMLAMTFLEFFIALELKEDGRDKDKLHSVPFANVPQKKLLEHLYRGEIPKQPKHCPPWIYKIMQCCWDRDRTQRPTAADVHKQLHDRLSGEIEKDQFSDEYNHYDGLSQPRRHRKSKYNPLYDDWVLKSKGNVLQRHPRYQKRGVLNSFPQAAEKTNIQDVKRCVSAPEMYILPTECSENVLRELSKDSANSICDAKDAGATCFCKNCSAKVIPDIPWRNTVRSDDSGIADTSVSNYESHYQNQISQSISEKYKSNMGSINTKPQSRGVIRFRDLEKTAVDRSSNYNRIESVFYRTQSLPSRESRVFTMYDKISEQSLSSFGSDQSFNSFGSDKHATRKSKTLTIYDKIEDVNSSVRSNSQRDVNSSVRSNSLRDLDKKLPIPSYSRTLNLRRFACSPVTEVDSDEKASYITASPS